MSGADTNHQNGRARAILYARFLVVGGASFVLNIGLTFALTEYLKIDPKVSVALVLSLIFVGNFLLARYWIFHDRVDGSDPWGQLKRCILVSLCFRFFEWLSFVLMLELVGVHYLPTLVAVMLSSFLLKTRVFDRYVFRQS